MKTETRSERFSVGLTPSVLERLDAYAADHRWTRSTAAAVLIEEGLDTITDGDKEEARQ